MGKPLDVREVEYAYVREFMLTPNNKDGDVFMHRLMICYEMKDIDKAPIGERHIEHILESANKLNTSEIADLISDNFRNLVRADKLELSGYDIA